MPQLVRAHAEPGLRARARQPPVRHTRRVHRGLRGAEPDGNWGLQEDGTDACADEWFAVADCFDGLSCDEHLSFGIADEQELDDLPLHLRPVCLRPPASAQHAAVW
jgi:hypothetical protein